MRQTYPIVETLRLDGDVVKHLVVDGRWTKKYQDAWDSERPSSLGWTPKGHSVAALAQLEGLKRLSLAGRCDDITPVLMCSGLVALNLYVSDPRVLDVHSLPNLTCSRPTPKSNRRLSRQCHNFGNYAFRCGRARR
jgi:hypothetical protein